MTKFDFQPWPSTYQAGGEVRPSKLVPYFEGRKVGAFRVAIPPRTVEPPQIHLVAERDGEPFQELLTSLDNVLLVAYFDPRHNKYSIEKYSPGQDIIIPEYKIHWLINPHDIPLNFTCEYAPHPWDGDNDEPEFPNLATLLRFVEDKGLMGKLLGE